MEAAYDQFEEDYIEELSITDKIEYLVKKNKKHFSLNQVLEGIFNKYNISNDNIVDVIKNDIKKCKLCEYKVVKDKLQCKLQCKYCDTYNECPICLEIISFDTSNEYIRRRARTLIKKCYKCNIELTVQACSVCDDNKCICGCKDKCHCYF